MISQVKENILRVAAHVRIYNHHIKTGSKLAM